MPRDEERKSHVFAKKLRRNLTHAEVILWQSLRRDAMEGLRFRRQHPIRPYIADFACLPAKLVVEVDGVTHGTAAEVAYDARRRRFMAKFGWGEIRVTNFDIYKNLGFVLDHIWQEVSKRLAPSTAAARRSPSPAEAGEDELRRS